MNIPGIYRKVRIARLVEDIFFIDSPHVECHRYALIEYVFIGFLRYRSCRYRTSLKYYPKYQPKQREVYQRVILPWLHFNDQPFREYLAQQTVTPIDKKLFGTLPSEPVRIGPISLSPFPFVPSIRRRALMSKPGTSYGASSAKSARDERIQIIEEKTLNRSGHQSITVKVTVDISSEFGPVDFEIKQ